MSEECVVSFAKAQCSQYSSRHHSTEERRRACNGPAKVRSRHNRDHGIERGPLAENSAPGKTDQKKAPCVPAWNKDPVAG